MKAELKPCPFCGEEPKTFVDTRNAFAKVSFIVLCTNCRVAIQADYTHSRHTSFDEFNKAVRVAEKEATKKWNRRVDNGR